MIIERPRLFAALEAGARVMLLRGEGGAGKTTLVSQWLASSPEPAPTVWISLNQSFRSGRSFWFRIAEILTAREIVPAHSSLHRVVRGELDADVVPDIIGDELLMTGSWTRLVVDDLHLLATDVQNQLAHVLLSTPLLSFIGLTRSATEIDSGPLAARLGTMILTSQDLAPNPTEFNEMVTLHGLELDASEVTTVHEIAGHNMLTSRVSLTALSRSALDHSRSVLRELVVSELIDAIDLSTLLGSADAVIQTNKLAVTRAVDHELAVALTGNPAVWELITDLEHHGIGRIEQQSGRTVFAMHATIRHPLVENISKVIPPSEVSTLRMTAANHLRQWGDQIEVLRLLVAAGAYESVWPYFASNFSTLTHSRRDDAVRVLERLPDHPRPSVGPDRRRAPAHRHGHEWRSQSPSTGKSPRMATIIATERNRRGARRPTPLHSPDRTIHGFARSQGAHRAPSIRQVSLA